MPFIEDYLEYTSNSESPRIFHEWCAIFCISAALSRRVFVDMGLFTLYPNFYIVIVAAAGSQRKSTAIAVSRKLISQLEPTPNIIAQKITPEALVDAMRMRSKDPLQGGMVEINEGIAIADELTSFISRYSLDAGLDTLLTSLYDCSGEFVYHSKSGGRQPIKNVFFTLLGGTTPDLIKGALPEAAIGAGITRRMILVYSTERTKAVAFPVMDRTLGVKLRKDLQALTLLKGPFKFDNDVLEMYEEQYELWRDQSELYKNPLTISYADTRWNHIFKVAMCITASETGALQIGKRQYEKAISLVSEAEIALPFLMNLIASNEQGTLMTWVEGVIRGGVNEYKMLVSVSMRKLTKNELDLVLATLEAAGRIYQRALAGSGVYWYLTKTDTD